MIASRRCSVGLKCCCGHIAGQGNSTPLPPPPEKPIDLFKAIFEDSSDDESDDDQDAPTRAQEPPKTVSAAQPSAGPLQQPVLPTSTSLPETRREKPHAAQLPIVFRPKVRISKAALYADRLEYYEAFLFAIGRSDMASFLSS